MSPYPPQTEPVVAPEEPIELERPLLSVGGSEGFTIHYAVRLAKKYLWLVLVCALLGIGVGMLKNASSPKEYTAQASIEITANTADQFRLDTSDYDDGYVDVTKIETEEAVLESQTLALATIQSLHLNENKNFLPPGSSAPWDLNDALARHALIGMFLGGLKVDRSGHTNILDLSYTTGDPHLAAEICNALIDNYVQHNFSENYQSTQEIATWLQQQLGDLKADLESSQEHMLEVQKDIGLVGIDQTQSIMLSRLVDLNHDLTEAESARLVAQAKLIALQSATPDVLPTLSGDPILLNLKQRLNELQAQYANQGEMNGDKSQQILQLRAEMDQVTKSIAAEQKSVIGRATQEVDAADANEQALHKRLNEETNSAYQGNSKAVEYTLARREYESKRTLYDGLQQRLQEAGIIAGLHSTDIRRIDKADAPDFPSAPRKTMNLASGMAGGLGIGLFLAVLIELFDTNIKSISDIEDRLGLPMLGVVPKVDSKQLLPEIFIADATSDAPGNWSRLAESYRSLRTTILLSRAGAPPQVVLISSAKPSEGKTSISTLEAVVFALNGAKVLLIDSDLRRPSVHLRFRIPNKVGLTSVLAGKASLEQAIVSIPSVPSLRVMPAGPIAPGPSELLGSSQMQQMVEGLRSQYDFILIDTPPVLTVTDAAVLVSLSDGVVLVLRYGQSSRNVVGRASEILLRSGAHLLGVVLNAVDLQSADYSEYYGRAYNDYYRTRVDNDE